MTDMRISSNRYVTGLDPAGKSCIVDLGEVHESARWELGENKAHDFWVVPGLPAPTRETENPAADWRPINEAPQGGVIGRLITWAPGFEIPMHATPTLDFVVLITGELELILETERRLLAPGDVVVQRGTAHGWRNPGTTACTLVVVMVDAANDQISAKDEDSA